MYQSDTLRVEPQPTRLESRVFFADKYQVFTPVCPDYNQTTSRRNPAQVLKC
jgi:hypothetical protein